ncbi:DUF5919 domain-containing protein [Actinomadura kijaniata]|uniref:DUF5919 domain-containing protein n=1 Tax=Actinomadura kijaniata TaxID=46161 RepID=UPI00083055AB|nr:DUF5919 domain-containing protein [Actinomadura kijaniata]
MTSQENYGELIDLRGRAAYRPDVASLARSQLAAARAEAKLTEEEFAELLSPMLGWPVTAEAVHAWETVTVPPGDALVAAGLVRHSTPTTPATQPSVDLVGQLISDRFSDVTAVYASRSEFMSSMPPHRLFDGAKSIDAVGLSLNLICQQYSLPSLCSLLESGTTIRCLFLDPEGEGIKRREEEERYPPGHLSALNALNIQTLQQRVLGQISPEAQARLQIALYDETIRFNVITVDARLCVVQPYLPETRGVDSPTILVQRRWPTAGLFPIFGQVFTSLWERSVRL